MFTENKEKRKKMKKTIIFTLITVIIMMNIITANAVATPDTVLDTDTGTTDYSIVSVTSLKTYNFISDFCDSYPYDETFETNGVFDMCDHTPDLVLTLKNNTTDETFTYKMNEETEWRIKTSIDYLLYETTTLDATLYIETLGSQYNINDVQVPIEIEVKSSEYEANVRKYSSYDYPYTAMAEGENFYVEPVSDTKMKIVITQVPHWLSIDFFNVETRQRESFEYSDGSIKILETKIEIDKPEDKSFWFSLPCRVMINENFKQDVDISVEGRLKEDNTKPNENEQAIETQSKATKDSATPDSVNKTSSKTNNIAVRTNGNAVATGETNIAASMLAMLLCAAFIIAMFIKKHNIE